MTRTASTSLLALGLLVFLTGCRTAEPLPESGPDPVPGPEPVEDRLFSPKELRADLDTLYAGLQEAHYDLFALSSRFEWEARHAELRASFDRPLTETETRLAFQRFVATANTGHARIDFPDAAFAAYRADGGRTVPFFIRVIDGRVLVSESYDGPAGLAVGDEILSVDGEPVHRFLDRPTALISAETPYLAFSLLEFWFPRLVWAELGPIEQLRVEVRRAETGTVETVEVPTRTADEIRAAEAAAPPRLSLDWNGRSFRMLEDGVGYLRPGPFYDPEGPDPYDPTAFADFVDRAFELFLAENSRDLVIDLRDNPGGDNSFSDLLVAWFADRPFRFCSSFRIRVSPQTRESNRQRLENGSGEGVSKRFAELYAERETGEVVEFDITTASPRAGDRFTGRVYVLVNRHSFSNAVNVAALVQDYGFATVIGEETSDMATAYGAMEHFELPRTGLRVGYPKAFIVRPNGDETLRGVVPDIRIEMPLVEGPDDPVLRRAVEVVLEDRSSE